MDFFSTILFPFKWIVSWFLAIFHDFFSFCGINPESGWTWLLSVVNLVIVIRIALIPIFVRQIKAQRGMQAMQPDLQKLKKKYKGKNDTLSRQAMAQEQQALFRKHGTNPFASCLPLLIQMPFFFSLYQVLNGISSSNKNHEGIGALSYEQVEQFDSSNIFGVKLFSTFIGEFNDGTATGVNGSVNVAVIITAIILIITMCLSQFITQKQIMAKNQDLSMSREGMAGTMQQTQKIMLYVFPVLFLISGINFPIGVLVYWTTTNLFTMGQQYYVIRRNPAPGSLAEKQLKERRAKKGLPPTGDKKEKSEEIVDKLKIQRQQPKKNVSRKKR